MSVVQLPRPLLRHNTTPRIFDKNGINSQHLGGTCRDPPPVLPDNRRPTKRRHTQPKGLQQKKHAAHLYDHERALHNWQTPPTHLESSTRASGRGGAPSLMASNHTRGSRLGVATKGFMSLFETCFCWVSSKLPTAPWLSSVATPVADNRRTAAPPSPFPLDPRRAAAVCCVDRASPVLRRNAAAEPAAPLPTLDKGAERKESVGPRESKPAATASTIDSLFDSDPPRPLCCCSCRPMVLCELS